MIHLTACGRLGRDSEVKTTESGKKIINFSIAIDQGWGDNKTTLWLTCKKWGENTKVAEFLKKGTQVIVIGEPALRTYTNKEGKEVTTMELTCSNIELVGGRSQEASPAPASQQGFGTSHNIDLPETDDSIPF